MAKSQTKLAKQEGTVVEAAVQQKPVRPLIFISHDHRDAPLAEAFANLLTDASGGFIKSFDLQIGKAQRESSLALNGTRRSWERSTMPPM